MDDTSHVLVTPETPAAPRGLSTAIPSSDQVAVPIARPSLLRRIGGTLPTLAVVGLLAGLAGWGHFSGWKIPKFADLLGQTKDGKDDWCDEHAVPESMCVQCNPSLLPHKHYGFCEVHGVQNCPFEHPDVAQLPAVPKITKAQLDLAERSLAFKGWPENSPGCKKVHRLLQMASLETLTRMNLGIAPVAVRDLRETVSASGELHFMPKGTTTVSSPLPGRVWKLTDKAALGGHIGEGEVLAFLDCPEVGKAKGEFLQAFGHYATRKQLLASAEKAAQQGVLPETTLVERRADVETAEIRLKGAQQVLLNLGLHVDADKLADTSPNALTKQLPLLGLAPDAVQHIGDGVTTANLLPIRAPRAGVLTEARANVGEMVEPKSSLFVLADPGKLWLVLNVRQEDVKYLQPRVTDLNGRQVVKAGQKVLVKAPGSFTDVEGELVWKSTTADEVTRTVQFAAELPNDKGQFLAHSFVTARVVIRQEKAAMVVPSSAVHWEGDCHVVFVYDKNWSVPGKPIVFHPRTVRPGITLADAVPPQTEIIAGLLPGESVATTNSAALRAELLKNNLGAG
jgi:cobalt-zinc-cadmium efflux system membrane fusion protein